MRGLGCRAAVFFWTLLSVITALELTGEDPTQASRLLPKSWRRDGAHALELRQANDTIAAPIIARYEWFNTVRESLS